MLDFKKLFGLRGIAPSEPDTHPVLLNPELPPQLVLPPFVPWHVLLVDDEEGAEQAVELMRSFFLSVSLCKDSQSALALVRVNPPVHIAVIDFNLGAASNHNGTQLASQLQASGVQHIVGITGDDSPESLDRWSRVQAYAVFTRPVNFLSLSDCINFIYSNTLKSS